MKTESLANLKKEIMQLEPPELHEIIIRLAKYKVDNKELIHYLLYERNDEASFITELKSYITTEFKTINQSNFYYLKKGIRRILRTTQKQLKYSGIAETYIEVLIHFCMEMKKLNQSFPPGTVMYNLYQSVIHKIEKQISLLHEDLQYDYRKQLSPLSI